jgi:inner membrane protein
MDPISQGVLGAIVTQSFSKAGGKTQAQAPMAESLGTVGIIGALAAMAPDLDVLISSATDPLLALEFHRHFTHSLLFIPLGAFLCSLVLHPLLGRRWSLAYQQTFIVCLLGFATHALLDGCTTYGTQLLWPLTDKRFAWDSVSVVDPLFTLPLLALTILAVKRQRRLWAHIGAAWVFLYLGAGFVQHERALDMGQAVADSRGHSPTRLEVKPSFGNLLVWKLVYETDDYFYVDALKPGVFSSEQGPTNTVWPGERILKLKLPRDLPWLDSASQQAEDIERFRWFSDDYLALDPHNPMRVIDIRYSMLPHQIAPLWGIELAKNVSAQSYVRYVTSRGDAADSRLALSQLLTMIFE